MNYIDRTKSLKDNKIKIIKFYAAQIVNSLSYLNERMHILHRDVKVLKLKHYLG
jgi:serine/threonine protein kinase